MLRYIIILLTIATPAFGGFSLKPGDRMPDLSLTSIAVGDQHVISSLTDKKMMLHLFASW